MGEYLSREQVGSHAPTATDWSLLEHARQVFDSFEVPQILDPSDPHSRIFFALADGTQNDLRTPEKLTNVALLEKELRDNPNPHVKFKYVSGVGTHEEDNPNLATKVYTKADAALSLTHRQRAEELYQALSDQVDAWKQEDAEARVSVIQCGFSRGCGVAALLNQMIHDRGVKGEKVVDGKLQSVDLIKPGELPQATLLYDPVTTFMKESCHLSDSTVSALQISAANEQRALFPLTIIAMGTNQLHLKLPGCHCDIGGGYTKDGLARHARDIGHQYLNRLAGNTMLKRPKLPDQNDPSVAIHHSWEHSTLYRKVSERKVISKSGQTWKNDAPKTKSLEQRRAELKAEIAAKKAGQGQKKGMSR
jgi:hypothetical protein